MRTLLVLSLLAGCGFEHGQLSGTTSDGGGGDADADITVGHWVYRKPITILGAQVRNGPHTRFVALIMWDIDDALMKHAANDGHDIRFFAGDGTTPLPYERVSYDAATGALQAWVQVPSIQQSMDTLIYMEYGNAGAVEQQNRAATWPPNVIGVWHLEDGTDSTGNANDAQTVNGVVIGGKGKVGRAATFDGVDDRLLVPDSPSLDSVATQATISTWINFKDATGPTRQFIMASSNDITPPKSAFEWATGTNGDNYFYPRRGDGDLAFNSISAPFTDGVWHHAAVRLNFSSKAVDFFIDGAPAMLETTNVSTMWAALANPDDWLWGSHPLYTAPFLGAMDEIRVTFALRGSGWLATEFLNQDKPGAFIRVGPEELAP